MAMKIRLARGGSKKRPFYAIVASDSRMPRDGRFIEKIGSWNPMLAKDDAKRIELNNERIQHWLSNGALPTDVATLLDAAREVELAIDNEVGGFTGTVVKFAVGTSKYNALKDRVVDLVVERLPATLLDAR